MLVLWLLFLLSLLLSLLLQSFLLPVHEYIFITFLYLFVQAITSTLRHHLHGNQTTRPGYRAASLNLHPETLANVWSSGITCMVITWTLWMSIVWWGRLNQSKIFPFFCNAWLKAVRMKIVISIIIILTVVIIVNIPVIIIISIWPFFNLSSSFHHENYLLSSLIKSLNHPSSSPLLNL